MICDWIIKQVFSYYPDCTNVPKLQIHFIIYIFIIYLNILLIETNSTDLHFSVLHSLRTFTYLFQYRSIRLFLKSFKRKLLDKCSYNFLGFSSTQILFLNFKPKNSTLHCVAVIYEKQQIFCGLAKKGENYSQKPMPKLFATVFSCSLRTVFSGVKRQKVKLQLTVTVLSQRCISQVL